MKIAVLISGRCTRYEVCLLTVLQQQKYEVDLFMSINDTPCEYYEEMKKSLSPWLRGLHISPFKLPKDFENHHERTLRQLVDGKYVPLHTMSMYFNDMNAFNMATKYADEHKFEYDVYMKFRADVITPNFPDIVNPDKDELKIYTVYHDNREALIDRKNKFILEYDLYTDMPNVVSDTISYGNRKTMSLYCSTYNFVLEVNDEWEGNYPINFDQCITHQIYDKEISIERFNWPFLYDRNRRIFDCYDTLDIARTENGGVLYRPDLPGGLSGIDIKTVTSTAHIPPDGIN